MTDIIYLKASPRLFVLPPEGVPAEEVARNAVDELTNNLQYDSCVDEHLQDQVYIQPHSQKVILTSTEKSLTSVNQKTSLAHWASKRWIVHKPDCKIH